MLIENIQKLLKEKNIDGWLFYDFHNRDLLAYKILKLDPKKLSSRRWYYYVPSSGEPVKLVSAVEKTKLDQLPGTKKVYKNWEQQYALINDILGTPKNIAMQYSPKCNIPYVSITDSGTIEIVRGYGHTIVSSADLVQAFEAIIDEKGFKLHLDAGVKIDKIRADAFKEIKRCIDNDIDLTEYELQQFIVKQFDDNNLTCEDHYPIVGVNEHPADPHFEPTPENSYIIKKGDMVLIDLWAKENVPNGIYYDITWCGYVGATPPEKYQKLFKIVKEARDAAVEFVQSKFEKGEDCFGWEVDDVTRNVIKKAGYGEYFVHRTGHSIGEEVHGNGVNIDNFETKDTRQLVPGICFSVEPGIYLEGEMAVRLELNMFITHDNKAIFTGERQTELVLI
jgi:Xaa-Pro aminopeptidase